MLQAKISDDHKSSSHLAKTLVDQKKSIALEQKWTQSFFLIHSFTVNNYCDMPCNHHHSVTTSGNSSCMLTARKRQIRAVVVCLLHSISMLFIVLFGKWTNHLKSWRNADLGDRILYITYEEMVQVKLTKQHFFYFLFSCLVGYNGLFVLFCF